MLRRVMRYFVTTAGLLVLLVTAIWCFIDRIAAEKIATAIAMPSGIVWIIMLSTTVWSWRARKESPTSRVTAWGIALATLVYTAAGNSMLSGYLAAQLEHPYVAIRPLDGDVPDVVIVLGGGGSLGANGRLQGNQSGDRLILAAQLYHRSPATRLICTGQRIESMDSTGIDASQASRNVLVGLGVANDSIELLGGRNTSEEMQKLGKRFHDSSQTVGVLTSAWHLPRAMRLAEKNGLRAIPLPADFRSPKPGHVPTLAERIESCIPSSAAAASMLAFLKEYLAMSIGR